MSYPYYGRTCGVCYHFSCNGTFCPCQRSYICDDCKTLVLNEQRLNSEWVKHGNTVVHQPFEDREFSEHLEEAFASPSLQDFENADVFMEGNYLKNDTYDALTWKCVDLKNWVKTLSKPNAFAFYCLFPIEILGDMEFVFFEPESISYIGRWFRRANASKRRKKKAEMWDFDQIRNNGITFAVVHREELVKDMEKNHFPAEVVSNIVNVIRKLAASKGIFVGGCGSGEEEFKKLVKMGRNCADKAYRGNEHRDSLVRRKAIETLLSFELLSRSALVKTLKEKGANEVINESIGGVQDRLCVGFIHPTETRFSFF
jgi:hypothetical protein